MLRTWTVNELAVACAYAMLDKPDPLAARRADRGGLSRARARCTTTRSRRCCRSSSAGWRVSVVNSAYQRHVDPGQRVPVRHRTAGLGAARAPGRRASPPRALTAFRDACGLEPCPTTPAVDRVAARVRREPIGPLLDPDPRDGAARGVRPRRVGSPTRARRRSGPTRRVLAPPSPAAWRTPARRSGIGRYDEVRGVLRERRLRRQPGNDGPEWRTVHLGLDLFVEPRHARPRAARRRRAQRRRQRRSARLRPDGDPRARGAGPRRACASTPSTAT